MPLPGPLVVLIYSYVIPVTIGVILLLLGVLTMNRLVLSFALSLALSLGLSAQTTGEILGSVSDQSGAAVAGAEIRVRNIDTNAAISLRSSDEGRFRVPQLPAGNYEVSVEKSGFAKFIQGPIALRLNQAAELAVKLQVSGTAETVTVSENAPMLNTTNAEVGVNFDPKRITELPLAPNRNILNLALSVAGVSQLSSGNSSFASGGVSFSVNGMRTRSNNFMVDGADSNSSSVGGLLQEINNPDTVAEFRLITNQFLPEYGRAAGSIVNIVTKGGTNAFHGSAYWFYNGNALNARSNLDKRVFTKAPWRVEDQFAGTIGGPVIKNKTFFFASGLRWTDHRFASGTAITGAPTEAGKAILQSAVGTLPQIQSLLKFLPAAQTPSAAVARFNYRGQAYSVPLGTLAGAAPNTLDAWQWLFRGDHRFNDKHSMFGRMMYDTRATVSGQAVPPGLTSQSPAKRYNFSGGLNSSLSASYFNELRVGFNRFNSSTNAADPASVTIPNVEVSELGLTGFNAAASRTAIGLAVNLPQSQVLNTYQIVDNFSVVTGNHAVKMGVDIRRIEQNQDFNPTLRGRLNYVNLQDYVDDIAQTASINVLLNGVPTWQGYKYHDFYTFIQDEWRIRPNFTLTYGIRYEAFGNAFDFLNGVNQKVVAANNNNPSYRIDKTPGRDLDNWAPRVGFNYRPGTAPGFLKFLTGNNQLVLRGGYSRTYDVVFNNIALNMYSAWPFTQVFNMPARSANSYGTIDAIRAGTSKPAIPADPMQITRTIVDTSFRSPLAEQFAFQMQRELTNSWGFTVGYVATKGTGLFQSLDGNPTVAGANGNGTIRRDPTRGILRLRANSATSIYHSLQTSLEKRLSRNFSMAAHYTWSSFIDTASEVFNPSVAGEVAVPQDSYNWRNDRGRSTYDRPHRLSINGTFELPFMRSQEGVLGRIVGGWMVSGFMTLQSGAPFSALAGNDPGFRLSGIDSLVGNSIRPNLNTNLDLSRMNLNDIVAAGGRTLFSGVSAAAPFGNAGRNILRADGINNVDLAINKNIRLWNESHRLNIRAEAYNLGNTRDYGIPEARVNNAGFGLQGNTDGGNRRIVLGLRYTF